MSFFFNFGAGNQSVQTIGGIAIGTPGGAGTLYEGYSMMAGDDFDDTLSSSIYRVGNTSGKYFPTRNYGAGGRSTIIGSALDRCFDADPFTTGAQDANKGVAAGFDNMTQTGSRLKLKARVATAGEQLLNNSRPLLTAMIHTGGYMAVTAPCIMEWRGKIPSTGGPRGLHFTVWALSDCPWGALVTNSLELDFPEMNSAAAYANVNTAPNPNAGWSSNGTSLGTTYMDGNDHTFTLKITASSVIYYVDGNVVKTEAHDGTITGRPYYYLFTFHTWNNTAWNGESYVQADWDALGATGVTAEIDYYRFWTPTGNPVVAPLQSLPTLQADYDTSFTYTFPSATALWGSAVTDYPMAVKNEDFEPGSSTEAPAAYPYTTGTKSFPDGLTYNSGTRVLSGKTTDKKPGRLWLTSTAIVSGSISRKPVGYIDIGPHVATATQNLTNGTPYSYNIYTDCDVGTLLPKTISVGTLPTGLSYDPATYTISGTPTVNGTTAVPITVTNRNGQSVTTNVSYVVSAAVALATDGSVTNNNTSTSTLTLTLSTTKTNDMIGVLVPITASYSILSIASSSGLTFTKRGETGLVSGGGNWQFYTAPAASVLTSEVITITFSSATSARGFAFAIAGVGDTANPFDANANAFSAGVWASHTSNTQTMSTDYANDLTIAFIATNGSMGTITNPTGFTTLISPNAFYRIAYKVQTSAQSSANITYSWTGGAINGAMLVDSFKGN